MLTDTNVTNNQKVGNLGCFQLIHEHTNTFACMQARTHARMHNHDCVNVLGQLMEHDGRLQDHDHRLGEDQSKTSFIGNIVYGIILGPKLHHASCYVPK